MESTLDALDLDALVVDFYRRRSTRQMPALAAMFTSDPAVQRGAVRRRAADHRGSIRDSTSSARRPTHSVPAIALRRARRPLSHDGRRPAGRLSRGARGRRGRRRSRRPGRSPQPDQRGDAGGGAGRSVQAQPGRASAAGELPPAADAELRVHALEVVVDRAHREDEALGDGPAGLALRGEGGDVPLTGVSGDDGDRRGQPGRAAPSQARPAPGADAPGRWPASVTARWKAWAASVAASAASSDASEALEPIGRVDERRGMTGRRGACRRTRPRAPPRTGRRALSGGRHTGRRLAEAHHIVEQPMPPMCGSRRTPRARRRRGAAGAPGRSPGDRERPRPPGSCSGRANGNGGQPVQHGRGRRGATSPTAAWAVASADSTRRRGPTLSCPRIGPAPRRATGGPSPADRQERTAPVLVAEPHEDVGWGGGGVAS